MKILFILILIFGPILAISNDLKKQCPMQIVPAKMIGPFNMYSKLISIKSLFPKAMINNHEGNLESGAMVFVEYQGLHISFCNKVPQDIWVDVQKMPENCLTYKGKKLSHKLSTEKMRMRLGGCKEQVLRIGGTFYECEKGLRIGIGSGGSQNVVDQIRIGPSLDIKCSPLAAIENYGCRSNGKGLNELRGQNTKGKLQKICKALKDKKTCLDKSIHRHDQPIDEEQKFKICKWQ